MSEPKEEWEIGYTQEHGADPVPRPAVHEQLPTPQSQQPTAVNFNNPVTLVGQHLDGRFLIERNLTDGGADAGGIGIVYLALDMKLMGRKAVVKILQKAMLAEPDIARKFQHEKEALIRLDHPNIVRILDSGELSDGNPFLVMEYIQGHSLRRRLRDNGVLPFDQIAHISESVCAALSAAHAKRILHRDIKPENIMLTPQESGQDLVRVIDFGIARVEESQLAPETTVTSTKGSIFYIAPEQLEGSLQQTPAVDIYSFAIVVYEMLTGKLPFQPTSVVNMFALQQQGVQIPPSKLRRGLSPNVDELLMSALEYQPEKRPQKAHVFGLELARLLRAGPAVDQPSQAAPVPPPSPVMQEVVIAPTAYSFPDRSAAVRQFNYFEEEQLTRPHQKRSRKTLMWVLLSIFALIALAIPAGFIIWKMSRPDNASNRNGSVVETEPPANKNPGDGQAAGENEKRLTYFLLVQKMRDGKPFEAPFQSSGQEILESGYKFKMVFQPDAEGFMYVYNEGRDAQGRTGFNILFPTPSANGGSSQVAKGKQIETAQNLLGGGRGTEVMWLIWTKERNADLEAVMKSAFDQKGVVDGESLDKLQGFLNRNKAEKTESVKDSANQKTVIKASGDTVVHRFEIEHR